MKNYIKFSIFIFLVMPIALGAQFNTITATPPKKEKTTNLFEKQKEEQQLEKKHEVIEKVKKEKKASKNDIKKELDSLKMLLIKYSLKKNKQKTLDLQRIEDSIIEIVKNVAINQENYSIKKFDFINDPVDDFSVSKIFMPLNKKLNITSGFGGRVHPIFGVAKQHNGIDLDANYENVYAVLDGVITDSGWDSKGGGKYIKINHSGRFETSYLHLSDIYYKIGEKVKAGYIIARSGNTGNSTGPHLHFAVKEYGNFINPLTFLNDLIKVNNLIALSYEK